MIVLFSWLVWLGNGSGSACITPYVHRSSAYASRTYLVLSGISTLSTTLAVFFPALTTYYVEDNHILS